MTDKDIEATAKKAGGRWDGSRWVLEDADLHPFARTLLAAERERLALWLESQHGDRAQREHAAKLAALIRKA